mgnify:CR=1 FL=1
MNIKKKIRHFLSFLKTNFDYIQHREVKPTHLFYGQMHPARAVDMLDTLNRQIEKFKSEFNNEKFIFVEIGSYLGESLKLYGNQIEKKLKNYLLISIDPYSEDVINSGDKVNEKIESPREMKISVYPSKPWAPPAKTRKIISKIYHYFINNISNYSFKHNHIHFRMKSDDGFALLKKLNIKVDFCYIDGSHYYDGIKNDYNNFNSILRKNDTYEGSICGDDYELELSKIDNFFNYSREEFLQFLNNNKNVDYILLNTKEGINKKNRIAFHPATTLFFSEVSDKIIKYSSGFWKKENL